MEDQLRRADLSLRQEAEFKLKEACQGPVRPLLELHMKMAPMVPQLAEAPEFCFISLFCNRED